MRKLIAWVVVALLALVGVWWLLFRASSEPSPREQFAALRATGVMFSPAERCPTHRPSAQDLTAWTARLAEAEARLALTDADPVQLELEQGPLAFWSAMEWALDDASWKSADAGLDLAASQHAELADVFRTIGYHRTLEACEVYAKLTPHEFHPTLDTLRIFSGRRAIELSLLRCARRGDLDGVQRDLEAQLLAAEKLQTPVSLLYFAAWAVVLHGALDALEGSLPLLDGRVEPSALERRLGALQPRVLLSEALTWERSNSLRMFEWSLDNLPPSRGLGDLLQLAFLNPAHDLALLTQGFELGLGLVRGDGTTLADLDRFQGELGIRTPMSSATLPLFESQAEVLRSLEMHLALARTALRLAANGRRGWEDVPRELDPHTGAPLLAELLDDTHVRLRAMKPGAAPEEQRDLEWTVHWR
jgi:hypothetical protein